MITKDELLRGRDKTFSDEYSESISENLDRLLEVMNKIRTAYGKPMTISSGWRPKAVNAGTANAAPNSAHCDGLACDVQDIDGSLRDWVLQNLQLMKDLGVFLEDFRYTPTWCHFGLRKPGSGKRIFIPNKGLPPAPARWPDQRYDSKYDAKADK